MPTRLKIQCIVYLILLLCRNIVNAEEPATRSPFNVNDPVLICSGGLAILITKVCDNVYKIVKRDTSLFMEKMAPKSVQEQKTKQRLLAKEHWRRVRRQVASECCDNPCTVGKLIMYCPEDATLVRNNPDLFED